MTSNAIKTEKKAVSLIGSLFIVLAVFFWGASAPLAKYLVTQRYETLMIVQTRTLVSFFILLAVLGVWQRNLFCVAWRDVPAFALLGIVGLAFTNFFYYYTVVEASVATAILIQYTSPVWVVLYTAVLRKQEPFTRTTFFALILSLLGCVLAVTNASLEMIQLKGATWLTGPLSALTYATQIVMTKRLLQKYSLWTLLLYMLGFATLFWCVVHPPWAIAAEGYSVRDWGVFALFAVVSILIPQTFFAKGLHLMAASTAGIMTTLEPVVAISLAFFILGEVIGVWQIVGGILVLGAVVMLHVLPSLSR